MNEQERYMQDFFKVFNGVERWGPGTAADTLHALKQLPTKNTAQSLAISFLLLGRWREKGFCCPLFNDSKGTSFAEKTLSREEGRSEIAAKVPMGRFGQPEELGELAELLISGRSSFITGQVINFTGG